MRKTDDPLDWTPQRIAVAGTSGVGKTTLCCRLADVLNYPRAEIDALYWGPGWTSREEFIDDVERFIAQPRWVMEYQYRKVKPAIAARADTLLWLDYATPVKMRRLIHRTLRRRLGAEQLWNGNYEPPLSTIFTDPDHILRWGWRTRHSLTAAVPELDQQHDRLHVVRLPSPRSTELWLDRLVRTVQQG